MDSMRAEDREAFETMLSKHLEEAVESIAEYDSLDKDQEEEWTELMQWGIMKVLNEGREGCETVISSVIHVSNIPDRISNERLGKLCSSCSTTADVRSLQLKYDEKSKTRYDRAHATTLIVLLI